ncbi:MAG: hypothetical protein ACXAD7_13740, partial [Candidatus Kariarchaeaceae archaeon]
MNAVIHQRWGVIYRLLGLIVLLGVPSLGLIIYAGSLYDKANVAAVLVFFIILGVAASPGYLKLMYSILINLIESKKAPWLVEEIEDPFNEAYQSMWNRRLFYISLIIPLLMEAQLINIVIIKSQINNPIGIAFWFILLILGHFGISLMLYLSMLSYRYVSWNSKIYDVLLQKINERVKGYTEGHESILSKKNYEVVGVLSDTPGLSVRSLGDIPILGLASSTAIFNAVFFIIFTPFFIHGPLSSSVTIAGDSTGITFLIIIGLVISLIASFGAIIAPIARAWFVIRRFKIKALTELDPFLFDEITGVALKRDSVISNETQVLYMLRNYIYTMKPSPVNPIRLIQIAAL